MAFHRDLAATGLISSKMKNKAGTNTFAIEGGFPIHGRLSLQGNKNEALPALCAALLTNEEVSVTNVPYIEDTKTAIRIIQEIGAHIQAHRKGFHMDVLLQASDSIESTIPQELSRQLRGSLSLTGPLLARNKEVFLSHPGGDRIGRRRLDTHFLALQALGAKLQTYESGFALSCSKLRGADILLDEASVTATENALCAAVLAEGKTIIRNAASEPHVQGLCHMLRAMGGCIEGIGSNVLVIEGVEKLHGTSFTISPDYLEAGSFIVLAALTGGELILEGAAKLEALRSIHMHLARLGIHSQKQGDELLVPGEQSLEVIPDIGGAIPRIDSSPWPGFPADMSSVALVAASQCKGTVLIHEKMFESRLFFTDRLIAMGARIVLCDPHRALVIGPSLLKGAHLSSPDIRAGMALLIAALCAPEVSYIQNIQQIDRGFSCIDERLRSVGAHIERI